LIVLCHGILGFGREGPIPDFHYFKHVREQLEHSGQYNCKVLEPNVSASGSVKERAAELHQAIEDWFLEEWFSQNSVPKNIHLIGQHFFLLRKHRA
jgi:hypothetical protein